MHPAASADVQPQRAPTPTSILITIDPGVDHAAAAIWAMDAASARTVDDAAKKLRYIRQCKTSPTDGMAVRLSQLTEWAAHLSGDCLRLFEDADRPLAMLRQRSVRIIVELPAFSGMYRGRTEQRSKLTQPNAKAMMKLYLATGAIVGGLVRWCSDQQLELEQASKVDRDTKQTIGRAAIAAAIRAHALHMPSPIPDNDDVRSAVYIGVTAISL